MTDAIEHAARSLALARECVSTEAPSDRERDIATERVRTEIKRVARLLEVAREPDVAAGTLNRAAHQLDEELGKLDAMLEPKPASPSS